jgi:hypothetical protein
MTSALPIVDRELRLAARRQSTYWIRSGSAALIGAVLFGVVLSANEPPSRISSQAFMFVQALCFLYCALAGVRFTADALSQERREGTLGLLFLTDLRGYDVVLGKMVITSLNAFFGLLAALPLLAVPVLMGGVSIGEYWRTTLVLVNTLLFSLGVGLAVSAFGLQERKVLLATLLILLLVTFGFPAAWSRVRHICDAHWLELVMLYPSPAHLLSVSSSGLYVPVPSRFWPCMATVSGLTLACLSVASLRLPRSVQEPAGTGMAGAMRKPDSVRARSVSIEHWAQLRFHPPYFWRLSRGRSLAGLPLLLAGVGSLVTMVTLVTIGPPGRPGPPTELVFGWFGLHWVFKFLVTLESARPFREDMECRALELLLASPLRPGQMLRAQSRRMIRLFGFPIGVLCLANLLISANINDHVLSTMFFMGGVLLPADCWALHWCGMHFSLLGPTFTRAVFAALWRVLVPPGLAFFVVILAMASVNAPEAVFRGTYTLWALCTVVYDLMVVGAKQMTLKVRFRALAAGERPTRSYWRALMAEVGA